MKYVITFLILIFSPSIFSQSNFSRHEASVFSTLGFDGLKYDVSSQTKTFLPGGSFGAGYVYFISPQWGIQTGVELAFYNISLETPDNNSDETLSVNGNVNYLQIPLLAQFQTKGKFIIYLNGGLKMGIPVYEFYPSIEINKVYMLSGEAGVKWKLGSKFSLYTGVCADAGLNPIVENNPDNGQVLQASNFFIDKKTIGSLGLKLRLSFHIK